MALTSKPHQLVIRPGQPVQMEEIEAATEAPFPAEQDLAADTIAKTIKEYVLAAKALAGTSFSHIRTIIPEHLSSPGRALVVCTPEGVIVRYEAREGDVEVLGGRSTQSAYELLPALSEQVVRIYETDPPTEDENLPGITLTLTKTSGATGESVPFAFAKIGFVSKFQEGPAGSPPGAKPFRLLSANNTAELHVLGEFTPGQPGISRAVPFIVRTKLQLPVGWQCIEFFPGVSPEAWNPAYAPAWAETDILAAAVTAQAREAAFTSLDPNSRARAHFARLFEEFNQLLVKDPLREEDLQRFLRGQPQMLCPTMIRAWPKLNIGATQTDFVFRTASGSYLLVELEPVTEALFKSDGHPTARLNHARDQVRDWKRYIEDNLRTVQGELGLDGITANPDALIIIGRSSGLSDSDRRTLAAMRAEATTVKVMTYDDLIAESKQVIENLLGPLWATPGHTAVYYPRQSRPPADPSGT